jgi:hypothetical protein
MSWEDTLAKLRHYQKRMMEAPVDSPERITWIEITRLFQEQIKTITAATVTVQE